MSLLHLCIYSPGAAFTKPPQTAVLTQGRVKEWTWPLTLGLCESCSSCGLSVEAFIIRPRAQHTVTGWNVRLHFMNEYEKYHCPVWTVIVTVQTGQMGGQVFNERENRTRLLALVFPHQLHPGWVESFITVSSHYSNVRRYEFKKRTDHTPFLFLRVWLSNHFYNQNMESQRPYFSV